MQKNNTEKPTNETNKFDDSTIITQTELDQLLGGLIADADYHPYAIYGLFFLFSSISKLIEHNKGYGIEDLCSSALRFLYPETFNVEHDIDRLEKHIHLGWREADFENNNYRRTAIPFLSSEDRKKEEAETTEQVLDLSTHPENLNILAQQISEVIKNPLTPENVRHCLEDELNGIYVSDTHSPETILANLIT